jgi:hypothetical protein
MVMTWERNILRKIYGPTYESGHWRIKINSELESKYKSQDIVSVIKVRRLEWLAYIIIINDTRTVKNFEEKLGGRRERGGGLMTWKKIKEYGYQRWRIKVLDRVECTSIIKEERAN